MEIFNRSMCINFFSDIANLMTNDQLQDVFVHIGLLCLCNKSMPGIVRLVLKTEPVHHFLETLSVFIIGEVSSLLAIQSIFRSEPYLRMEFQDVPTGKGFPHQRRGCGQSEELYASRNPKKLLTVMKPL